MEMVYYKIVYHDGGIDVKAVETIDEFLEDVSQYEGFAQVDKIEEDEYKKLQGGTTSSTGTTGFFFTGTPTPSEDEFITDKMNLKITILNCLVKGGSNPEISDLDKYYDWVVKE